MKNQSFSAESTNPRQRRAYAHALRDKALMSGEPQDKLVAVEAASNASATTKGKDLGKQALSTFRRATGKELKPGRTNYGGRTHIHTQFDNELNVRAKQAVASVESDELGVSVSAYKPEDRQDYMEAAQQVDSSGVRNKSGMLWDDGTAADKPRTEAEINNIADYHLDKGSHLVDVLSTHDTGNFYDTVEAVVKPHGPEKHQ